MLPAMTKPRLHPRTGPGRLRLQQERQRCRRRRHRAAVRPQPGAPRSRPRWPRRSRAPIRAPAMAAAGDRRRGRPARGGAGRRPRRAAQRGAAQPDRARRHAAGGLRWALAQHHRKRHPVPRLGAQAHWRGALLARGGRRDRRRLGAPLYLKGVGRARAVARLHRLPPAARRGVRQRSRDAPALLFAIALAAPLLAHRWLRCARPGVSTPATLALRGGVQRT